MKILSLMIGLFFTVAVQAQTRYVLLEEFTGAHCGQCPMGSYFADSMSTQYPNLIVVALHAYSSPDSMFFPTIDTPYTTYAGGAPLAAIDRINPGGISTNVGQYQTNWASNIQARLAVTPSLDISVLPTWNSGTRNISAQISVDIISNMPAGDYRIGLYVAEDSVIGTGSGYDQVSFYDALPGNPFYGMGNPIVNYVHRHVVRALLPNAWGQAGVISSTPTTGMNFVHTIHYTLPPTVDENKVKLIAFAYRFSSNHETDEVLNATEEDLVGGIAGMGENEETIFRLYPNPADDIIFMGLDNHVSIIQITLTDISGRIVKTIDGNMSSIAIEDLSAGVYQVKIIATQGYYTQKLVVW